MTKYLFIPLRSTRLKPNSQSLVQDYASHYISCYFANMCYATGILLPNNDYTTSAISSAKFGCTEKYYRNVTGLSNASTFI